MTPHGKDGSAAEFVKAPYGSALYRDVLALRDRVLRRPLGLSIFDDDLSGENAASHYCALQNGCVIGTAVALPPDAQGRVRIKQVAVKEDLRNAGIGRALMNYAEEDSKAAGACAVFLHARKSAADFYLKLGYQITGPEFTEIGLPHVPMEKKL